MRLNPTYPAQYLLTLGVAYHVAGRYAEAIAACNRARARNPNLFGAPTVMALSYSELGQEKEARAVMAELLKLAPDFSLENFKLKAPFKDPAVAERWLDLLHGAGVKWRWPTDNPEALGHVWSGLEYLLRPTPDGHTQARQQFERAMALDPQYAAAHAFLGLVYLQEWVWQWSQDSRALERALALTQQAIVLDASLPWIHRVVSAVYIWNKQPAQALAAVERAIALDPNDADGYVTLAEVLNYAGQPEKAIGLVEKAMRLNPQNRGWYVVILGWTYQLLGRHEKAIAALKNVIGHAPNHSGLRALLAVSYSEGGREEEARAEGAELLRLNPNYAVEVERQRLPYKDPAVLERVLAALRKAGLQ
jgi:tetratricopeptide (TPR) repeat protein